LYSVELVRSSAMAIRIHSRSDVTKFIDEFDSFILDCDGVLWQGGQDLPGSGPADPRALMRLPLQRRHCSSSLQ
jgi:hypothetical protein